MSLAGLCIACASQTPSVRSSRADANPTTTLLLPPSDPDVSSSVPVVSSVPDLPTGASFPAEALLTLPGPPDLAVWPEATETEVAIHALAPATDGWLAVGSVIPPLGTGIASLWHVAADGTFGEPESLGTWNFDQPSVARDVLTVGSTTIVAGYQGAGTDASAVVWVQGGDGLWTYAPLATEPGLLQGTIADEVLALADGTIVVIGRGDGPFHNALVLWWSIDGGTTWNDYVPGNTRAFLPPLAATDGARIAMLLRSVPNGDGLAAYETAVITWDAAGPTLDSLQFIDPTPGVRYWPQALVWDGAAFVSSFETEGAPAFATSVDGVTYTVQDMDLPGLVTELPVGVEGMVLVDGLLTVFVHQGDDLTAFQRAATGMVPIELPYVVAGHMTYLEGDELFATDGHRVAYLAIRWTSKVFLSWDGSVWAVRDAIEVPSPRNFVRLDLRDVVQAGDSRLGLLNRAVSDEPGVFIGEPSGVVWQPPGETTWMLLDIVRHIPNPTAVVAWQGAFLIAAVDYESNTTTFWQLDPDAGEFTEVATMVGRVRELASGVGGMIARVIGVADSTDSTETLWASTDGRGWSEVQLPGRPAGLCSDGATTAVVWMRPDEERDTVGVSRVDGTAATTVGAPADLDPGRIATGYRDIGKCGVNDRGVISVHVGYEGALAQLSPLTRSVRWQDGPNNPEGLWMNMTAIGSSQAMVNDIEWTGTEWVAVGFGYDVESSMDAMLWRSADGLYWDRGDTIAGGPGSQEARSVLVDGGQLLISGRDVQQATIWFVPV